jgi:hypothetical protein
MKAKNSMIAYNTETGEVRVGPWPDKTQWSRPFPAATGACYLDRHKHPAQWKMMVFIDAIHIIVREKIDPMTVHNALLAIDEYVDGCADDMPGIKR